MALYRFRINDQYVGFDQNAAQDPTQVTTFPVVMTPSISAAPVFKMLNFNNNETVSFMINGQKYMPYVDIRSGDIEKRYFLFKVGDSIVLRNSILFEGRIFVLFEPDTVTTIQTNTSLNWWYYNENTILDSNITESLLFPSLTDIVHILRIDTETTISRDCTPNCLNKLCTDNSGCGYNCGCVSKTSICNSGVCVDRSRNQCNPIIGYNFCEKNYTCMQQSNSPELFHCVPEVPSVSGTNPNTALFIIIAISSALIIIFLAAALYFYITGNIKRKELEQQLQINKESNKESNNKISDNKISDNKEIK